MSDLKNPVALTRCTLQYQIFEFNFNSKNLILILELKRNNGRSVVVEDEAFSRITIGGGGLAQRYRLTELHFHWGEDDSSGSEHSVDGNTFPLEMHAVTIKDSFKDIQEALNSNDKDALAVMAVFFVNEGTCAITNVFDS